MFDGMLETVKEILGLTKLSDGILQAHIWDTVLVCCFSDVFEESSLYSSTACHVSVLNYTYY